MTHKLPEFADALWSAPIGLVLTDTQGTILTVNPAFQRLMGFEHEELIGKNPRVFQSGGTPVGVYRNLWSSIKSGRSWEGVLVNKDSSGGARYVKEQVAPFRGGFLAMHLDVTELTNLVNSRNHAESQAEKLRESSQRLRAENVRLLQDSKQAPIDTALALVAMLEAKDRYTAGHSRRVEELCMEVAARLGLRDTNELLSLRIGALLHDVGKVGVPDDVLLKQGWLQPGEMEAMQLHPVIGYDLVSHVTQSTKIRSIVRSHHENLDGSGYPDGLRRDQIPLLVRIVRVCDSFDAMTSNRAYRKALSREAAEQELVFGVDQGKLDRRVVAAVRSLRETGEAEDFQFQPLDRVA